MLKLIRPVNLLIVALTMYLVRYCLIQTQLQLQVLDLQMEDIDFALLTISVLLITAGGYIVNDVLDTDIDAINKPGDVIIGGKVSKNAAMRWYMIFNMLGVLLGLYVGNKVHYYQLSLIHLVAVGLLWFYSSVFKKMILLGNIVVAVLSAIIVFIPVLFEPARAHINSSFILGYAFFALLLSLTREIIKDAEDLKGDEANGCRTLPVVWGVKASKGVAIGLLVIVAVLVDLLMYLQYNSKDYWSFFYFLMAVEIPLLVLIAKLVKAATPEQFHKASTLNKVVMLGGILSMLVFRFTLV